MRLTRSLVLHAAVGMALVIGVLTVSAVAPSAPTAHAAKCANANIRPGALSLVKLERAVECLVNQRRRFRGRSRLKSKASISNAAARHSRVMVRKNCFAHTCSGELDLSGRLHSVNYLPCNCTWQAAENIAWGDAWRGTARNITRSWMRSPTHRRNILTRTYQHAGVGVTRGRPGRPNSDASATFTLVFGSKR